VIGEILRFPLRSLSLSQSEGRAAAERILATPVELRRTSAETLHLEDPEQLLNLCDLLRRQLEVNPARVREESVFFFDFLETPDRRVGSFDERDYYLGEFALIAGTACRFLAKREEGSRWLERAESHFVLAHNPSVHIARVAYQRLALRLEERRFEEVSELAPRWRRCFIALGLAEDALKCRFLEAQALKETERLEEAKQVFKEIGVEADALRNDRLAAIASQNLFQIHAFLGETEAALQEAQKAEPILRNLDSRVHLAKLQLGVGYLLRGRGELVQSITVFRDSQRQFAELEMHADVAATHLVLADLLLEAGQPAQAEWEIRAALPVIDELKLVPEGIAALSLLRDSLRRRQIDRQALRSLNGYFEELSS
jgi:hypothetical protein